MSRIFYLSLDLYEKELFDFIRDLIYDETPEHKPKYENDEDGLKELKKFLTLVKVRDYYPTFFHKAAYLFITISQGHAFKNGNKRLAIVTLHAFISYNRYDFKPKTEVFWENWFEKYFPEYEIKETPEDFFTVYGWAFYNINRAINMFSKKYSFDDLQNIIKELLKEILEKPV
ncbi:type II toxin-antitoxin system death-on-curing family toxin [Candidatus Peregrinibacteria bacterium]|nr:type II toxin-antitoxin system death-on-curing family toxin [Candidatus Peregrinibacteria bacterium]